MCRTGAASHVSIKLDHSISVGNRNIDHRALHRVRLLPCWRTTAADDPVRSAWWSAAGQQAAATTDEHTVHEDSDDARALDRRLQRQSVANKITEY